MEAMAGLKVMGGSQPKVGVMRTRWNLGQPCDAYGMGVQEAIGGVEEPDGEEHGPGQRGGERGVGDAGGEAEPDQSYGGGVE